MHILFIFCALLFSAILSADDEADITQPFLHSSLSAPSHCKGLQELNPNSTHPIAMANLEGAPSSFVQSVNVITGQFCDSHTDLVIHHAIDPLTIERCYMCDTKEEGVLGMGWNINHCTGLMPKTIENAPTFVISQDNGGALYFFADAIKTTDSKGKTKEKPGVFKLNSFCLEKGVTNTGSGYISGQTNLKNYYIISNDKTTTVVATGSGGKKTYTLQPHSENQVRCLSSETRPSGNKFIYIYDRPNKTIYLDSIRITNSAKKAVSTFTFPRTKVKDLKKDLKWELNTADGRWVRYHFSKSGDNIFLKSVDHSDSPSEEFTYEKRIRKEISNVELLNEKLRPENRYVHMEYYDLGANPTPVGNILLWPYDAKIDRVKRLLAPAGHDAFPVGVYNFIYHLNGSQNGSCEVLDAYGHRALYDFDKNHRLTHLHRYHANGQHYTTEHMHWAASESHNNTNLMAHSLEHIHHGLVFAHVYHYDERGNVQKDSLYGNLSGHCPVTPQLQADGLPVGNGCDGYCKFFEYSKDGFDLVLKEWDGIQTTRYQYAPGTNRLIAKFHGTDTQCYQRSFYSYNDDAALTKSITDDGTGQDSNDLTGVTERHITYCTPSEAYPVGFPLVIEEKCLDLSTGKELLVHKVVNHYTRLGKIDKEDHYDANGVLAYTLVWEYDAHGNITKEIDAIGRVIERRYDANDNCIFEQGPRQDCHKIFTYDFMNRRIREEEVHSDGVRLSLCHRYDFMSRRMATIDQNGNETHYTHDAFGRVIEISYPDVLNEGGVLYRPKVKKTYDPMGNVTCETDAKGFETKKRYTLRGQVAETTYADGTSETSKYHWDGTLWQTKAKNGTSTTQTNDPLGRPVRIDTFSASGVLLTTITKTYSAFHLLSETDAMGNVTQYTYHPDGKLKSKKMGNSLTTYAYDQLGHLCKTCEHYGPAKADVMVKCQQHDVLGRVIDETVEDCFGTVQTRVSYEYDIAGNVCRLTTFSQGKSSTTTTVFDSHGTPAVVTDALGNKTVTTVQYNYRNRFGQCVPYQTVTDANGNITAMEQDALGRTVSIIRKNSFGKIIQKQQSRFDANGNCCELIDTVISPEGEREVIAHMEYDSDNRLLACYEAVGTPEQKQTKQTYNIYGQKQELLKADGTMLFHAYDAFGRLSALKSSDNTVHYAYRYDRNSNPIQIDDLVNGTSTYKSYDSQNRLTEEKLAHGLTLKYAYDGLGRPTIVTLPDNSGIGYQYQVCFMQSVARLDAHGQRLYAHTYEKYDLAGRLLGSRMAGQGGKIAYEYDQLGRETVISSTKWQESLPRYDSVGNLLEKNVSDGTVTTSQYKYDDLYQVTNETGDIVHDYAYDSHYNRLNKDGFSHTLNALHQLLDDGKARYAYDGNGNLQQKIAADGTTTYTYDALDRMVSISEGNKRLAMPMMTPTGA